MLVTTFGALKNIPDIVDVEVLVNIGKDSGPCPYYLTREVHKEYLHLTTT